MEIVDGYLKQLQELNTYGLKTNASLAFGKLPDGRYAVVCDYEGKLDQTRKGLSTFFRDAPVVIVFKNKNDVTKLDTIDKSVDTELYQGFKGQKLYRSMKIISKGTGSLEGLGVNVIIRKIKLKPFKENSLLVVRLDLYAPSQISKTTHDIPANVYYRKTGNIKDLKTEVFDPLSFSVIAIGLFALSMAIVFTMFFAYKASAKKDKKLGTKLKSILKDGRNWEVYVIKEESPNAFCMATPTVFVHSGLIKMLTEGELMAVLIHEAGHIKNKDMWKNLAATNSFLLLIIATAFAASTSVVALVVFFALSIMMMSGMSDVIFARTLGRLGEKRADSNAVKHGYGKEMASALAKLDKWIGNIKSKRPCGSTCQRIEKISGFIDEHPPMKERIADVLKEKETYDDKNIRSVNVAKKMFMKKFTSKK